MVFVFKRTLIIIVSHLYETLEMKILNSTFAVVPSRFLKFHISLMKTITSLPHQ